MLLFQDAVLVPDPEGWGHWWHMTCRDQVLFSCSAELLDVPTGGDDA